MKPRGYLPRYKCDEKLNVYSGAPVNRGFYERNLNKARPIYLGNCFQSPRYYSRKRKDRELNRVLSNYYDDYNKFKHKFKLKPKNPQLEKNNFNCNLYEIKQKNLSSTFFIYDSRNSKDADFTMTDDLINSMYDGKNSTLIKSTQNKKDYELRLIGFKKKKKKKKPKDKFKYNNYIKEEDYKNNSEFKEKAASGNQSSSVKNESKLKRSENLKVNDEEEEEEKDDEINYLKDGDKDIDDNYLKLIDNNIDSPLLKDILKSDFNVEYKPPKYQIPQSVLEEEENNKKKSEDMQNLYNSQRNQALNKYKDGELKRFQDIIKDNEYPCFEQITNPYYQTNYIPPPCFPKMPEDEEESGNESYIYDEFGFDEDNKEALEEDDDQLILLSNQITNNEFPMFEHLLRNDFKGYYAPPTYKIPSHIKTSIQKAEEKYQKEFDTYQRNKAVNVGTDVNQYDNGELKMLSNIIKDDKYPKFEQLIDPYYQTNYIPPDVFPKPEDLEERKEEESYGYGDFELDTKEEVKGDDDENNLVLISKALLNKEYPMFNDLISSDFKGNYAPPFYKIPEFMKEKEKNIAQQNRELFNQMRGTYINPNEHQGDLPVLGEMINNDYDKKKQDNNEDDEDYSKFE